MHAVNFIGHHLPAVCVNSNGSICSFLQFTHTVNFIGYHLPAVSVNYNGSNGSNGSFLQFAGYHFRVLV